VAFVFFLRNRGSPLGKWRQIETRSLLFLENTIRLKLSTQPRFLFNLTDKLHLRAALVDLSLLSTFSYLLTKLCCYVVVVVVAKLCCYRNVRVAKKGTEGTVYVTLWEGATPFCTLGTVLVIDGDGDGRDDLLCYSGQ